MALRGQSVKQFSLDISIGNSVVQQSPRTIADVATSSEFRADRSTNNCSVRAMFSRVALHYGQTLNQITVSPRRRRATRTAAEVLEGRSLGVTQYGRPVSLFVNWVGIPSPVFDFLMSI